MKLLNTSFWGSEITSKNKNPFGGEKWLVSHANTNINPKKKNLILF